MNNEKNYKTNMFTFKIFKQADSNPRLQHESEEIEIVTNHNSIFKKIKETSNKKIEETNINNKNNENNNNGFNFQHSAFKFKTLRKNKYASNNEIPLSNVHIEDNIVENKNQNSSIINLKFVRHYD